MGMYCKKCRYDLSHCVSSACPECGRAYDAGDAETYAPRAQRSRVWMKYVVAVLLSATLLGILEFHPHYVRARSSKGGGTGNRYVIGDVAVMRNAIETYANDHAGTYPTLADLQSGVLTRSHVCPSGYSHGPYLRRPIPACFSGNTRIASIHHATSADGWAYDETTGQLLLIVASRAEYLDLGYGPSTVMIAPKP